MAIDRAKIKILCNELYKESEGACHFNYVFDKHLVMGTVMDVSSYGIQSGTDNNIIGDQNQCAHMFYYQVLLYVAQIKEILGYSGEQIVFEVAKRLWRDVELLNNTPAVIGFKIKPIHKAGKA